MSSFVWADLSTYDPQKSIAFYEKVFGWQFHEVDGYFVAMYGGEEVAGLFETPDFFKKIKMPHFWMSYIAVDDALATAEIAKTFDQAKVELRDDFYGGKVALIRDPQGAGYTVYDGGRFNNRCDRPGRLSWNELHVSNASAVIPFYERQFGWKINEGPEANCYNVFDTDQKHIADMLVIPNELKGDYEYWVCSFAVENLEEAKQQALNHGGKVVSTERHRVLLCDNSGEAFFYIQQT